MQLPHQGLGLLAPVIVVFLALGLNHAASALTPQKRATKRTGAQTSRLPNKPRVAYTTFSHQTHVTQQKLACDSCHKFPSKNWKDVRKGEAAIPDVTDFPEHSSCLNCHRQQFFARERPAPAICSNCHIKVTPRDTARYLFSSLGDVATAAHQQRDLVSEFQVGFPHDKHLDVVSFYRPRDQGEVFVNVGWQEKKEAANCAVCHQTYQPQGKSDEEYVTPPPKNLDDAFWLKKGTFQTIPSTHTTCFGCHNPDLGIAPAQSDCGGCHKLKAEQTLPARDFDPKVAERMAVSDRITLTTWRRRLSSGTFRHEGGDHPNLSCVSCHKVEAMNTLEPKTLKVGVKSCGGAEGCHVTATSDDGGILNYEVDQKKLKASFVCTKCHIKFGEGPLPANHVEAISTLKPAMKPSL